MQNTQQAVSNAARVLSLAMLCFFVIPLVTSVTMEAGLSDASAQQDKDKKKQKTRKVPAIRANIFKKLEKAQELAEAKQFAEATEVLDSFDVVNRRDRYNDFERAQIWNFYAFIYSSKEDYKSALQAYLNVLKEKQIPEGLEVGTLFTVAQLYFIQENYRKVISTMKVWFSKTQSPNPNSYIIMAQAYYQLKEYRNGIPEVKKAMALAREKGRPMKENWYLLLRVMHYELNEYPQVRDILEILVRDFPKREYWLQLAGMYAELKQEKKQFGAMEAAHAQGLLKRESELLNMAQLYLYHETPIKGARILQKGMKDEVIKRDKKNLKLLAQSLRMAQEHEDAIPVLAEAAKVSNEGELYFQLGQSYFELDKYNDCVDSIETGQKLGGIKRPDTANIMKGMCLFNLDRLSPAIAAFREAAKQDKRSRKMGNRWISFLTKERERRRQLRQSLGQ
ncbi:MAG: hypothetical protein AAF387_18750 [Pseudomonadota bacterium]